MIGWTRQHRWLPRLTRLGLRGLLGLVFVGLLLQGGPWQARSAGLAPPGATPQQEEDEAPEGPGQEEASEPGWGTPDSPRPRRLASRALTQHLPPPVALSHSPLAPFPRAAQAPPPHLPLRC